MTAFNSLEISYLRWGSDRWRAGKTKTHPPTIHAALTAKRCQSEAVLEHIGEGDDVIVGMFNSEPLSILDALEANAETLSNVRIHLMFPYRERRYMHGVFPGLRHVSWFLSPVNREAFHRDTCDLVPNNFSEVPALILGRGQFRRHQRHP